MHIQRLVISRHWIIPLSSIKLEYIYPKVTDLVMSRDCGLNLVVGARNMGKSLGFNKKLIDDILFKRQSYDKDKIGYLYRYDTEIDDITGNIYADMNRVFGTEYDVEIVKKKLIKVNGIEVGYLLSLNSFQKYRKQAYLQEIRYLIFDEFLPPDGKFLPSEFGKLRDIYDTLDRNRNRLRVYMLSNNLSITNPYFMELGVKKYPEPGKFLTGTFEFSDQRWILYNAGSYEGNVSGLYNDSKYAEYALGNNFLLDTDKLIAKRRSSNCRIHCSVLTERGAIYRYVTDSDGMGFLETTKKATPIRFVVSNEQLEDGILVSKTKDRYGFVGYLKMMVQDYVSGNLRFSSIEAKNFFDTIYLKMR